MAAIESEQTSIFPALPKTERGDFIVLGKDTRPQKNTILYCNDVNVYMRDITKPDVCDMYCDHRSHVRVAMFNETGNYIASGDKNGIIRIWDTINKEHILKLEIEGLSGPVKDICWGPGKILDDTALAFCGGSRGTYAKIVKAGTGTSKGNVSKSSKPINNIAVCPNKTNATVTASENMDIQFFTKKGYTLEYNCQNTDHKNFVNCVRYSPSAEVFISGGADGQALIFNGETGERIGELVDSKVKSMDGLKKAHSGGIYSISFNDDGTEFLTVSGDKSAKIWNVASRELLGKFFFGKELTNMQVGCLWMGDNIMTVSLTGFINFLDRKNATDGDDIHTPCRVIKGHNQAVTSLAVSSDGTKLFSGSMEIVPTLNNALICWDLVSGTAEEIQGQGHKSMVLDLTMVGNTLISISMDDTIRFTDTTTNAYDGNMLKLPSQPRSVAAFEECSIVCCYQHIVVVNNSCKIDSTLEVKFDPQCVAVCQTPNGQKLVAIGALTDQNIHIFSLEASNTLTRVKEIKAADDVVTLSFSQDGSKLAAGTGSRKQVHLYDVASDFELIFIQTKQTTKISSVSWSPDGRYFASGSNDGSVAIWANHKIGNTNYVHFIKGAHLKSRITRVRWISDSVIVTCGPDGNIKQFQIKNL